jgi:cardiolipin synthase
MHGFVAALGDISRIAAGLLTVLLAVKRDSRSAVAWVGLIWLVPVVGSVLYVVLGINRVRRRAVLKRGGAERWGTTLELERPPHLRSDALLPPSLGRLHPLAHLVDRVTSRPLLAANAITPLENGEAAYPAMLAAIDGAQHTVALSTYIFDHDAAGRLFADALGRAARRGVQVLVLIDDVGARYSWPSMVHELKARGITLARFEPTLLPWRWAYMNLRNHRKLLIVDGRMGFAGGMNIREGHMVARSPRRATQDLHFRIEGPVVGHLMQAFGDDWLFTTGWAPSGEGWYPALEPRGQVLARGITDGPDEDFEKARLVVLGALACARTSVGIVTPYFLPDAGLISALTIAAMRGVRVDIVLPGANNQVLVHWAAAAQLWQVVKRGCRVYYSPPPFDHTKLMVVDSGWALIGSSNWDARSLRLNFEFDVECYDGKLAGTLQALIEQKVAAAREVTARDLDALSLPVRVRNGIARLAAPYL